jgi:hypothetical protein
MPSLQEVNAASEDEAKLLVEIAKTKDRLIKLNPEFQEQATQLRSRLRPHDADALEHPYRHTAAECERAMQDARHNLGLAAEFAGYWHLPWMPSLNLDPMYLVECPFSGAPIISGTGDAVVEWGEEQLPTLFLRVDMRFPKRMLRERIDNRLDAARGKWKAGGGEFFVHPADELQRCKSMIAVGEERQRGATQEAAAMKLGLGPRYVQRLEAALEELADSRGYWQVAVYTHMAFETQRLQAEARHFGEISRLGVPVRGRSDV